MLPGALTSAAVALLVGTVKASPVQTRQTVYGCYFNGDGIVNQYVTVGQDIDVKGTSQTHNLDCGTTSQQFVPGVYAKCTVDGAQPVISAISGDAVNINCTF